MLLPSCFCDFCGGIYAMQTKHIDNCNTDM